MHLDPTSGVPLYLQIVEGLREDVASGVLRPGQEAPSLRELAAELRVNYHTVARAWQKLEEEGVLVRKRGGAFVVAEVAEETAGDLLRRDVDALIRRARALGCDEAALLELVRERLSARRTA